MRELNGNSGCGVRYLSTQLLVNAWNISLRIRFDTNLKHNFVFFLLARGLASMSLEDVVNLDAMTLRLLQKATLTTDNFGIEPTNLVQYASGCP